MLAGFMVLNVLVGKGTEWALKKIQATGGTPFKENEL